MLGQLASLALAAALALGVGGCDWLGLGYTPVGDITRDPVAFEGKEVKLRGTAHPVLKLPFAEAKGFRLEDATGEVLVWTSGNLPKEGQEVALRGRVESALIVGGESFGLAVTEKERLSAPLALPAK